MSRLLIFDTETTGTCAEYNVILQLSYQIIETDSWDVLKEVNHYFDWPEERWRVQPGAIAVNGLTEDFLSTQILSNRRKAIKEFINDLEECEGVVGHNVSFDIKFMEWEARREGVDYTLLAWPRIYDTMKSTVNLCKLPRLGHQGLKYPKLSELADYLAIDMSDLRLHDSSCDVEITKRCFIELCYIGHQKV